MTGTRRDTEKTRQRVRQQYERFPYPTPQHDLQPFLDGQVLELGFPGIFFHRFWPRSAFRKDLDILVAGCGSTQAARYAAAHPEARVTGIDLSRASLDHSRELAGRYELRNLTLSQLAIEDAGKLDADFDLIVSTGVIHHLPEPEAGLRALRPLLRRDGAMHLMVYAPYGRDAIYYLQTLMREAGVTMESVTEGDLPDLVRLVESLPREHPLWHRRRQFPDLGDSAELVDYLLHPQDRAFTLRQCRELLAGCGLALQDVFNRAYYAPRCSGLGASRLLRKLGNRSEFEQFEAGEIYRASLTRHDLIACRDDRPEASRHVRADEPGDRVIPVRMPGVREAPGTPRDGKAACLQWPAHAFEDIRLPVDGEERAFFRAIDNESSVATLLERIEAPGLSARIEPLLRALVDYDLVWLKSA